MKKCNHCGKEITTDKFCLCFDCTCIEEAKFVCDIIRKIQKNALEKAIIIKGNSAIYLSDLYKILEDYLVDEKYVLEEIYS